MVDPDHTATKDPTPVRLIPGDRLLLDMRLQDLDTNLSVGNRALAAHALEQLAAEARRSARTLRGAPAVPAEETQPRPGVAATTAAAHDTPRAGFGFTVAHHAFGFTGGLVCLAGLGVVWWLAGGRPADFPALLDTLDRGAPLTSWHWQPVATAGAALLTAALADAFDAASRWALRRQGAARLRQLRRRTTTARTDQA